jgi:nucleotide-binding universal stress UspA family protein
MAPPLMTEGRSGVMETQRVGERILIPLDGSRLAESALPVAVQLAKELHHSLVLARIIPLQMWAFSGPNALVPAETYQALLDEEDRSANEYIERMAEIPRRDGIPVTTVVTRGEAASTLIEICGRLGVQLIVMTTHGRTGMARMALGSVADQMVRRSRLPVLVLRPPLEQWCVSLRRAIVPLDGSPVAEAALAQAQKLAGPVVRELILVRVVDPDQVDLETEAGAKDAEQYLEATRQRLMADLAQRDCTVSAETLLGDPAERIVRRAQRDCDLVILATRGLTGARRWVFGSTADRVLHDCTTPLLLIHPPIV